MTSLGGTFAGRTRKHSIRRDVSGDLSFSYAINPRGMSNGVGLSFGTKKKALNFAHVADKIGWSRAVGVYQKRTSVYDVPDEKRIAFRGRFRQLPRNAAKPYLEHAYGDYADRLRRKR